MKKIILATLILFNSLFITSCTEEDQQLINTTAEILTLALIGYATYERLEDGEYYYRINRQCNSRYVYYFGQTRIYNNCRYYSRFNGHFITTRSFYDGRIQIRRSN